MEDYNSTITPPFPFGREEKDDDVLPEVARVLHAAKEREHEEQKQEGESLPDWDGSEAEYVEDTDAAVYEERYTGIKISYQLTREEVADCLKHAGGYQRVKARTVIETVLCAVLCAFFAVEFVLSWNPFQLFLCVLSGALIAALWWGYHARIRQHAGENSDVESTVTIYPDELEIGTSEPWTIPLDGTSSLEEYNGMLLLYPTNGKLVSIPIRSIEPSVLADVQAMLVAGTVPHQEEEYD